MESDGALPFLTPAHGNGAPDLTLRLTPSHRPALPTKPWYCSATIAVGECEDGSLVARFADGTTFAIDAHSITLLDAPAEYTRDDVAAYALGPVLAIALHLQGAVLLHAAAVLVKGRAILFAGDAGSGKSTVAAAMHQAGHTSLADDIVEIVDDGALASAPAIRLWPDVLDALFGWAAAFPDRAPSWPKKILAVGHDREEGPHPIGAILFLDAERAAPRIESLAPRDGWERLIANVYNAPLPGAETAKKIFATTTALADRVPMFHFAAPPLDAIAEFVEREIVGVVR